MPRTVSATEAKNRLGSIIEWVLEKGDEVIVENRGTPAVVIISVAEYEKMAALKERARRAQVLEQMRELRERVSARNRDLSPEEGDALADRFARDVVEDLVSEAKIRFEQ